MLAGNLVSRESHTVSTIEAMLIAWMEKTPPFMTFSMDRVYLDAGRWDLQGRDLLKLYPEQWFNDQLITCYAYVLNKKCKEQGITHLYMMTPYNTNFID